MKNPKYILVSYNEDIETKKQMDKKLSKTGMAKFIREQTKKGITNK